MSMRRRSAGFRPIWRGWSPRGRSWAYARLAQADLAALPEPLHKAAKKTDEFARGMAMGGTLFEELGFYYVGPIDGHNLDQLMPSWRTSAMPPKGRAWSMS
jgi:hypothetical protein